MGQEGDDRLSLPNPPPPRPAARREAIDAALRKFDGMEDAPAAGRRKRPLLVQWASTHRAAAGGLVTAALFAVIAIPAIQVAIRDNPQQVASEDSLSERAPAGDNAAGLVTANEPPGPAKVATGEAVATADEATSLAKEKVAEERANRTTVDDKAVLSTAYPPPSAPAPMLAVPPPPPPAPPPPPPPPAQEPQAEAADSAGNIIVTGSRTPSANAKSSGFAQRAEAPATPREIIAPFGDFLNRLQEALGGNDRGAVVRLVGLPLRVDFAAGAKTYRTRQEVERDYDRIFTPAVRQAILSLGTYELTSRDGGKLRGSGRIWFGCGLRTCSSDETVRVREITP